MGRGWDSSISHLKRSAFGFEFFLVFFLPAGYPLVDHRSDGGASLRGNGRDGKNAGPLVRARRWGWESVLWLPVVAVDCVNPGGRAATVRS